jgi:predicted peptidase
MRSIFAAVVLTAIASTAAESRQQPARLPAAVSAKTDNLNDRFWLYLPRRYHESDEKLPLMIYLHGSSRRGTELDRVKANGIPPLLDDKDDWDFVVASPQSLSKYRWQECWRPDDLKLLVDHLVATYRIDPQRIYLTGLSMGGYGVWATAAAHPQLFAAAVPICGGGNPDHAAKYGKLPIWAFHGEDDYVVPIRRSREMVDAIKKAGGNAKLTAYPDTGHDSFTRTYANPELFKWLLSHRRPEKK